MTQDTNTTSGAADLRAEVAMIDAAMVEMTNITPPLKRSECARLLRAALAAGQATAAQPGAAYAVLPAWWTRFIQNVCEIPDRNSPEGEPDAIVATPEELAECALAAIESDRASHGQAPAQPAPAAVAGPSDDMVLAAARVISPSLFSHGLKPLPKDSPHIALLMLKEAALVSRMLDAALAAQEGK